MGELVVIEKVRVLVSAAKIEHIVLCLAFIRDQCPFLNKSTEGGNPCSWTDHNDRGGIFLRKAEVGVLESNCVDS